MLLTGASGLLGGILAERLARSFVLLTDRFDVAAPGAAEAAVEASRPDAVVHSAALADVDRCERDPDAAWRVNVDGTEAVAAAAARRGLPLVVLSTDTVFDGAHAPLREDAVARPLQVYGRSKLAGEQAALALCPDAAVLRVCLVAGRGHGPRGTATESVAWALRAGRRPRLFSDQYRTPVDADSVADAVRLALERRARGIFHLGGPERVSRYELGLRVAAALGLSPRGIEAVAWADQPAAAPRPPDVSFDSARARAELGWRPRDLDAAILLGRAAPDILPARS